MERVTKIMVKSKYSPISGITREVDGMISVISRRKTVRDRRTEMHRVIFSPQSDGRDNEINGVEERQTADDEAISDIRVDLTATIILLGIISAHCTDNGPFPTFPVVLKVNVVLHALQINLGLVIILLIKGEEGYINAAGTLIDGWRHPLHTAIREKVSLYHMGDSKLSISTGEKRREELRGDCLTLNKLLRLEALYRDSIVIH
ncbi:hypothetical protein L345_05375, partial [Ophiophagus hannah]